MTWTPERRDRDVPSREEVLSGLVGPRVSTALYAIEARTAYLALKARYATAPVLAEGVLEEQERVFLATFAAGRDLPAPTIQALDQFAPQWAYLVPTDASARSELAHRFGDKYRFRESDAGRLRAALGLDEPAVRQAYRQRHGADLDEVYDTDLTRSERLRWTRSRVFRRLEELPPFWTTYGLTLTETVGAGTLALPIAVAGVGPLPGVALIVVLGLLNMLTVAAVAETFTRAASVRWGGAFFGRVIRGYLGATGGSVFGVGLFLYTAPVLLACYVGFGVTVGHTTGSSPVLWGALLFAANIGLIYRNRLDATVASALLIGAVNVAAILILAVLGFTAFDVDKFTYVGLPFVGGRPFDPTLLELVFGVILLAFYGHTSVGNVAAVVLKRDPGGRSLLAGCTAAMVTVIVLYSLWVLAVGSAVAAPRLLAEDGTALVPLAQVTGQVATVVGSVFVFLAIGMGTVNMSLGLYNLVVERFVDRPRLGKLLGLALVTVIFVAAELLLITGTASFAGSLGLVGALAGPLMGGVFPMLMLLAARRRGAYVPDVVWRWMGTPPVAVAILVVFLATEAVYIWVWPSTWQRLLALAVLLLVIGLTVLMLRSGALRPRAVVEVRRDAESGRDLLLVTNRGRPIRSEDLPLYARNASVDLAPLGAREVWVFGHLVDDAGDSQPLAMTASVAEGDGTVAEPDAEGTFRRKVGPGVLELRLPGFAVGRRAR